MGDSNLFGINIGLAKAVPVHSDSFEMWLQLGKYKNDHAASVDMAATIGYGKRAQMMMELMQYCAFCRNL
jgi:hypothetical protein